jgi:glycosyltransferase involved in cell wall biosynthesis
VRLVYLHCGTIPSIYANGVQVMRMCDAFTEAGHDVVLYALPGSINVDDVYDYYGVRHRFPIRRIGVPPIKLLGLWLRAVRVRDDIRRQGGFDLAYGRDPWSLLAVAGLGPFTYETHLLWDSRHWRWVERRLFRARTLERVVVISKALEDDYRRAFPELDRLDLVVAPDGADPPELLSDPTVSLPGRPEVLKVGYVGHLYPGRGIDVILDLAGRLPGFDFHLVGGTIDDHSSWERQSHHPNVYFHGHQPPAAVQSFYHSFDLVLAPYQTRVACAGGIGDISRWVSPMKLFEYMAHGKAIIASDLPVLCEILTDRVNCLLCPPDNRAAWEKAITELAGDQNLRQSLGQEAQRQLLVRYTWRRRVEHVLASFVRSGSATLEKQNPNVRDHRLEVD